MLTLPYVNLIIEGLFKMGMYSQFKTDASLEKKGIVLDYGDFRVTIGRAGGANKRFNKVLEAKTKPYRRAIQTETMDPAIAERLLMEVYSEVVVINWEVKEVKENKKGEEEITWKVGIEAPDGTILPFCNANIATTFENLPDLFKDIQEQANKVALFRQEIIEGDTKNS